MAPDPGQARPRPASRIPSVRNPQARPQKVREDGAVNNGAKAPSRLASEPGSGSVVSGSIGGNPFHRGFVSTADAPPLLPPSPAVSQIAPGAAPPAASSRTIPQMPAADAGRGSHLTRWPDAIHI